MLFQPKSSTTKNKNAYAGFRNNQSKMEAARRNAKKGKINPSQEMNHHFTGLR